jgi:hypothetical protein
VTAKVHNEPDAVLLFRDDPEEAYGVRIFKEVRVWLGIDAPKEDRVEKIDRANIELIDLRTLHLETARERIRAAVRGNVHVFIQGEILHQFADLVGKHRLERIRDKLPNLMWTYQVVPKKKRSRHKVVRFADADYVPGEEIPLDVLGVSNHARTSSQWKGLQ